MQHARSVGMSALSLVRSSAVADLANPGDITHAVHATMQGLGLR
jgi:hypothetical protein